MIWDQANQTRLSQMAADGLSASQAGTNFGVSRNAILGIAFRAGIKFHGKPGVRPKKIPAARKECLPKARRAQRGGRAKGQYSKPRFIILQVMALYIAGVPARKAARAFGCSKESIYNTWKHDAALMAEATVIAVAALADARTKAAERVKAAELLAQDRRDQVARINDLAYRAMPARHVAILRSYVELQNMAAVGDLVGLTRERVRQIVKKAEGRGFIPPTHGGLHRGYVSRAAQ